MRGRRFSKFTPLRFKPCFKRRYTGFTLRGIGKTQSEQEYLGEVGPGDDNLSDEASRTAALTPKEPRSMHGNPGSDSQVLP